MLRPSTLFRLTVLAGVACLARAIVREAVAERSTARRLPPPERGRASPSRTRPAGRAKVDGRRGAGAEHATDESFPAGDAPA